MSRYFVAREGLFGMTACAPFVAIGGSERIGIVGRIAHHDLGWEPLDKRLGLRRVAGLTCR